MRILPKAFIILFAVFISVHSYGQKPTTQKGVTKIQKFKPPKLYTFLSAYKDSAIVPLAMAESILGAKLRVYDDKKTEYTVTSYQFLYKKKTVTEDEQTGKTSPATSIVSDRFTATPLPQFWIEKIREGLKSGEELYFFDVIAKDAKGIVMYASALKIIVQ